MTLAPAPNGFTASEHAQKVRELLGLPPEGYTPRHAAYDLKKLRGKDLVTKVVDQPRRYQAGGEGLRAMAAMFVLRDKVIVPLLTYNGRCKPGSKTRATEGIDARYQAIQREMQHLFKALRIAA